MTKQADDAARAELLAGYRKPDLSNAVVRELEVRQIDCRLARGYIAAFHYSQTMPDSSRFIYGLYCSGALSGVCVFGMGAGKNQYTAICPGIKNGEYIELTRLWLEDTLPRNSESYFISRSIRMLPKEIKMVVSFSDELQDHYGYIYQASNFIYLGRNDGGNMLVTEDGVEKHPRLLGIYRMRHPEYRDYSAEQLMELLGYKYVRGGCKHRYVYFRDKRLRKTVVALPYPKKVVAAGAENERRETRLAAIEHNYESSGSQMSLF